jgi:hypothetical protein
MVSEKYALLDTDFISKMHMVRKDDNNRLIDKIMAMPNYRFYCHEQIRIELLRHNISGAPEWFETRLKDQSICLYDDEMIIKELSDIYGELASVAYLKMLKDACDAYKDGYYEENFIELSKLENPGISRVDFLKILKKDCDAIGEGKNLGELKSYVLLQLLHMKFGQQIYVFCSDDKNARNGIVAIGGAVCISVLSSFIRLQKEIGFNRNEAEAYIRSYMSCCLGKSQTTFKIQDTTKERRMCKVPCEQVFDEMFQGKIAEMKTGNLRYIE